MISGSAVYDGINIILALAALAGLFSLRKAIADRETRRRFVAACVLLILSGIVFSVCLNVFRFATLAYAGEAVGKVERGTYHFVDRFKTISLLGNIFDVLAVALMASVSRRLMSKTETSSVKEEAA